MRFQTKRPAPRFIRQDELDAIRARIEELLAQYARLADGEHMELVFPEAGA